MTAWILFVFLANGGLATVDYPDFDSCITAQRAINLRATISSPGYSAICLPATKDSK